MHRKLEGKELEDLQVRQLIEEIRRRLARIEAEVEAAKNRYTVIFELGQRNLAGGAVCWRARELEHGLAVEGETLEEAALLMAQKLSSLRGSDRLSGTDVNT